MVNTKKIGLTLAQMLVGCCAGVLAGGVSLFCVNYIWRWTQATHLGNFLTALLLLVSFLIVYSASVVGTAEGVRRVGRFIPRRTSRRKIYEGAFLGLCAAVAILTVTRGDWVSALEESRGLIKLLGSLIHLVLIVPVKLATGWIPARFFLLVAGPIGAAIGYNIAPQEEEVSEAQDSDEQPASSKREKSTK